ncbi:hypothetical protein CULT_2480007 [[Clostridium] ultunense Esp]|nr:hypothetical protein CULT_2480007 [[Clostridium] ultunense Esp]
MSIFRFSLNFYLFSWFFIAISLLFQIILSFLGSFFLEIFLDLHPT